MRKKKKNLSANQSSKAAHEVLERVAHKKVTFWTNVLLKALMDLQSRPSHQGITDFIFSAISGACRKKKKEKKTSLLSN